MVEPSLARNARISQASLPRRVHLGHRQCQIRLAVGSTQSQIDWDETGHLGMANGKRTLPILRSIILWIWKDQSHVKVPLLDQKAFSNSKGTSYGFAMIRHVFSLGLSIHSYGCGSLVPFSSHQPCVKHGSYSDSCDEVQIGYVRSIYIYTHYYVIDIWL